LFDVDGLNAPLVVLLRAALLGSPPNLSMRQVVVEPASPHLFRLLGDPLLAHPLHGQLPSLRKRAQPISAWLRLCGQSPLHWRQTTMDQVNLFPLEGAG
jgi:hypothetical protein